MSFPLSLYLYVFQFVENNVFDLNELMYSFFLCVIVFVEIVRTHGGKKR